MAVDRVRNYLKQFGAEGRIREFDVSSATVELASKALGVDPARITKTLSFDGERGCILIAAAGDARIDNAAFKARFGRKARMLTPEAAVEMTGYAVGGVCPFDIDPAKVEVYLDESLKRFGTVFPACGSANSAIELTPDELERFSRAEGWVDVCKAWRDTYPRVIDMHVHVFPDELAPKACAALSRQSDGIVPCTDLTLSNTVTKLKNMNISGIAALSVATKAKQCDTINRYQASIKSDFVHPFGALHPECDSPEAVVDQIAELGLYGVKLHPDYQGFFPDDPRMMPAYRRLAALKLPVIFHAGWDPVSPDFTHSTAQRLRNVLDAVPDLIMIAAHMGSMKQPEEAVKYLGDTNAYIDTSMSCTYLSDERFAATIDAFGADRVLFASDTPWSLASLQLDQLRRTISDQEVLDKILCLNAERLLKINQQ